MAATVAPLLNGITPSIYQGHEALEYEKILKIRDEVFAGSHPRLTLPTHAVQPSFSQSDLAIPASYPASASPNRPVATQPPHEQNIPSAHNQRNISEFDPVLLTKSDDLVRAEIQLRRQRLEKALKEQFEQKRLDSRKKPAAAEAKPDFDLQAILAKVVEASKDSPKGEASSTDSVDENSFYSSRAPDSIQEGPSSSGEDAEEGETDEPVGPRVSAVMGSPLGADGSGNTDQIASRDFAKHDISAVPTTTDLDDEEEEGEYSPPEATENYPLPANENLQAIQDSRDPRSRPLRRYSELDDNGRRAISPSDSNLRIVRNQITSPIAPQPSRVSPLAVAKDQQISQNPRQQRFRRDGRPGSPTSPDDNVSAKKRKRMERQQDRQQKRSRRNGGFSPDAFIKEENVSPPPFHDVQPLGSGKLRPTAADPPIIIHDDEPIQETRYVPAQERYVQSPMRPPPRQVEHLIPQSEPRVLSRTGLRPVRDDQDLRRVASMHNMRAETNREYADPYFESPTHVRATSYGRMGSPGPVGSPGQLREITAGYERAPLDQRVVRTPALIYREVYDDGAGGLRYMDPGPPPPRVERIVVDEYGQRFREIIQREPEPPQHTMSVRRNDIEPPYENYRSVRAGSAFVDAVSERPYPSEMPPPPLSYRRAPEQVRGSVLPGPAPREYVDQVPASGRAASVQLLYRQPQHQPMHGDDLGEYREPVRMASVRPPATRYEIPPQQIEMVPRGQSTRPIAREGSVFVDDRAAVRHEYLPTEQPRYRAVEPEKRYVDAQGRQIIEVDRPLDSRHRLAERYQ